MMLRTMKRGRKPIVDFNRQMHLFQKYGEILRKPHIKYNDPIFLEMSQELDSKMSPRALYLSFKRNFNTTHLRIVKEQQQTSEILSEISNSTSLASSRSHSPQTVLDEKCSSTFSFDVDMYDFKKITPLYQRRKKYEPGHYQKYITLPKFKWSHMIKEKIWLHSKLPCTWTLKKHKIRDEAIHLKGKCSQCRAEIEIKTLNKTNKIHTFICNIHNLTKNFKHNPRKKTKLTPYKRRQLAKQLKYKPAVLVRSELMSESIACARENRTYITAPVLPSINALRQVKCDAKLGELPDVNPLISLFMLAKNSAYKDFIREILIHPNFHIYYWSNKQIDYYKMYCNKFERVTITLDATGSFFEKILLPDGTLMTKSLFLYSGLITANKNLKSVPIFQMITDAHSTKSILDWLKKWRNDVVDVPHEIITDESAALLSANIQAFTLHTSTKNYINDLFSVLEGKTTKLPETFIRLDTSHFIKTLHNLSCFRNNKDKRVQYFYIRCIKLLKKCEDYNIAKKNIEDIIEICLGQYDDDKDVKFVKCAAAKERLDNLPLDDLTDDPDNFQILISEEEIEKFGDFNSFDNIDFMTWFDELAESKKSPIVCENKNLYSYPPFLPTFKRLLYIMPLWSNLLCSFYKSENKSPSSSASESHFKTLKNLIFKTKLSRYRIDQFMKICMEYLEGEVEIALCDLFQNVKTKRSDQHRSKKRKVCKASSKKNKRIKLIAHQHFPADSIFSDKPSFRENWKGQAEEEENTAMRDESVKFIRNGNLCAPILIDENGINLRNTCALDSVLYLLSLGCKQNKHIDDIIDTFTDKNIQEYLKCLRDNDSNHDFFTLRSRIALQYFNKNQTGHEIIVDCCCNVTYVFETILINSFSSAVTTKTCLNESCAAPEITRNVVFLPLNLQIISVFGINSLEEAISFSYEGTCLSCHSNAIYGYKLSSVIFMDLNGTKQVTLQDVPEIILIKSRSYRLLGGIEFLPSQHPDGIGHYRAHAYVNGRIVCYDDNLAKTYDSKNEPLYLHALIYAVYDL